MVSLFLLVRAFFAFLFADRKEKNRLQRGASRSQKGKASRIDPTTLSTEVDLIVR